MMTELGQLVWIDVEVEHLWRTIYVLKVALLKQQLNQRCVHRIAQDPSAQLVDKVLILVPTYPKTDRLQVWVPIRADPERLCLLGIPEQVLVEIEVRVPDPTTVVNDTPGQMERRVDLEPLVRSNALLEHKSCYLGAC